MSRHNIASCLPSSTLDPVLQAVRNIAAGRARIGMEVMHIIMNGYPWTGTRPCTPWLRRCIALLLKRCYCMAQVTAQRDNWNLVVSIGMWCVNWRVVKLKSMKE